MSDDGTAVSEAPRAESDVAPVAPRAPAEASEPARIGVRPEAIEALARRLEGAPTAPSGRFDFRAPNWLQALLIFALFGAAIFVGVNGRYLWCALLAVAGTAFGASYVLRRMVGDEYDRA